MKFATIILTFLLLMSSVVYAHPHGDYNNKDTTISLYDLGVLQLAAHDLFNVDRETEIDHENGLLDLSTLFDYGEENIVLGGEGRNRENIILASVSQKYGEKYVRLIEKGFSEKKAKKKLLRKYHRDLSRSYEAAFGEHLPRARKGKVTMTENLALRTIHDFLPGEITLNGETISPVESFGETLSRKELRQKSGPLDGQFDPVFLDIVIFIPPDTTIHIDLLEKDSSFADQFNTKFSFEYFMEELEDGEYDRRDKVMKQIRKLFAKGLWVY